MIKLLSNTFGVTPAEITEIIVLFGYALGGALVGLLALMSLFAIVPVANKGLRLAKRAFSAPAADLRASPAR